ncbi:uncharacterized protein LOC134280564 [Saccostrea cucullata]|uniref:uncharacterized protein LOC134280564 n=1 Tax=Saccostrea cuccullata TaxID=36930 RepID=UPI002ED4C9DF
MLVLLFWYQPSDSCFLNRCILVIFSHVIFWWGLSGSVDANTKLLITRYPTEGAKGVLSCRIYAISENVLVQWNHNGVVINCTLPLSTCTANQFYSASISRTFSNLTVWKASFARDDGLWTCTVNNLKTNGAFYVVTEPKKFVVRNENNLTRNDLAMTAEAYCVYPYSADIFFLYQVKGDPHFQIFKRRNLSLYYEDGKKFGCDNNEYVLRATGMIKQSDFSSELRVRFKFQYISLSGKEYETKASDFFNFTDDPCNFIPCKNGGHCIVDAKLAYTCICVNFFSGKHCENSPQKADCSRYQKNDTGKVCVWIIVSAAIGFIISVIVYIICKKQKKACCSCSSVGREPIPTEQDEL